MQTLLAEASCGSFSTKGEAARKRDELLRQPAATAESDATTDLAATAVAELEETQVAIDAD